MATLAQINAEVLRIVEEHIDALTTAITTHVQRAQRAIEDRCGFAIQRAEVTYQVMPSTTSYTKPADFVAVRKAPYLLERSDSTQYRRLAEMEDFLHLGLIGTTGVPRYWREIGEEDIAFWPIGDSAGPSISTPGAYEITVPYYKRLTTLSADGDENWWSQHLDDVLAWRAAAFVFAELRDPMAQWWSSAAAARYLEVRNQHKRNRVRQEETRVTPAESLSARTQSARRWYRRQLIARVP